MEMWIGVTASLLGVIVGGLLQHLTAQRGLDQRHDWDRARIVHEKLELIAEIAEDLGRKMSLFYIRATIAVASGSRYEPDKEGFPLPRLAMLVDFYAPELLPDFQRVIAVRDRMEETIVAAVAGRAPAAKSDRDKMSKMLLQASVEVSLICGRIAKGASQLARKRLGLAAGPHHEVPPLKHARK